VDPRLLIIIATFNEKENLPLLVTQLRELIPGAAILIVDDSSPDGTGKWAIEQAASHDDFFAIVRKDERGLGSATLAGFRWGLEYDFDYLATLDADFSHEPLSLVKLVETVKTDDQVGVVVGSRYVKGGQIQGWPIYRRVASRLVNWLSQFWLGLKTRDNSGAFRVYRASSLAQIELNSIQSQGYGYLEEILFRLQQKRVKVVEIPIIFRDREAGSSKASIGEGLKVVKQILLLRFK